MNSTKGFVEDFIRDAFIFNGIPAYTNRPPILSTMKNIRKGKKIIKQLTPHINSGLFIVVVTFPSVMGEWLKKNNRGQVHF